MLSENLKLRSREKPLIAYWKFALMFAAVIGVYIMANTLLYYFYGVDFLFYAGWVMYIPWIIVMFNRIEQYNNFLKRKKAFYAEVQRLTVFDPKDKAVSAMNGRISKLKPVSIMLYVFLMFLLILVSMYEKWLYLFYSAYGNLDGRFTISVIAVDIVCFLVFMFFIVFPLNAAWNNMQMAELEFTHIISGEWIKRGWIDKELNFKLTAGKWKP